MSLCQRGTIVELVLRKQELLALVPVLQAIKDLACAVDDVKTLEGCFVRVKRRGVYKLERIVAVRPPPLEFEGSNALIPGHSISDSNPFLPGEDAAYERSGRAELLALQAALEEARGPPGSAAAGPARLELGAAAGAAWRKKGC
ncbi:hypothetical protein ABPG75_011382 [Micractinium tetrahymenae]